MYREHVAGTTEMSGFGQLSKMAGRKRTRKCVFVKHVWSPWTAIKMLRNKFWIYKKQQKENRRKTISKGDLNENLKHGRRIAVVSEQIQAPFILLTYEDKDKKEPVRLLSQKCLMRMRVRHGGKAVTWLVVYGTFASSHTHILFPNPCALSTRDLPSSKRWEVSSLQKLAPSERPLSWYLGIQQ